MRSFQRNIANATVLVGAGEPQAAMPWLHRWWEESSKDGLAPAPGCVDLLASAYAMEGDFASVRRVVDDYFAAANAQHQRGGPEPRLSEQTLTLTEDPPKVDPSLLNTGAMFRPLPHPASGGAHFLLVGGPVHYLDVRDEYACDSSDEIAGEPTNRLAENFARTAALTEDTRWLRLAVDVTAKILDQAVRNGDDSAWALSLGYANGQFRDQVRAVVGRVPTKIRAGAGTLAKPARSRWLYDRESTAYMAQQLSATPPFQTVDAPRVAIWRWPGVSDSFLQAWCDTIASAATTEPLVVLPDTPAMRSFARRYVRREYMTKVARIQAENKLHFTVGHVPRSTSVYHRPAATLLITSDGTEVDGDLYLAALQYLDTHYQLRVDALTLLADPLMSTQLPPLAGELRTTREQSAVWTEEERQRLTEEQERLSYKRRIGEDSEYLDDYTIQDLGLRR
ncbi:hypothetical protein [Streptomyces sp. NPDC058374]|uniref:hypothetical protein n=1 Tax=Streptomyces sp. NPDC058374 TaxID=3346466 RepID=UPI00364957E7